MRSYFSDQRAHAVAIPTSVCTTCRKNNHYKYLATRDAQPPLGHSLKYWPRGNYLPVD